MGRCVSKRRKGAASGLFVKAYSPGQRRKKKPNNNMSAIVLEDGVFAV
jgi:hypothetical protein